MTATLIDALKSTRWRLEREQIRRLEVASMIEASTLILLVFVAVPLKHLAAMPAAVSIVGPVHGLMFLAYTWTVLETVAGGTWRARDALRLFLVAFIPFGGFLNLGFLRCRALGR